MKTVHIRVFFGILVFLFPILLQACLDNSIEGTTTDLESYIPHPPDWQTPSMHGLYYVQDPGSCRTSCHGTDLKGGFTNISCAQCHDNYPHGHLWAAPEVHGVVSTSSVPPLGECVSCHGGDFNGGISGVSCFECHSLYPHEKGWALPSKHGRAALPGKLALARCATRCHGATFEGGLSGVQCYTCHAYPHGVEWALPEEHGATSIDLGVGSCAGLCHGRNFEGGDSEVSCYTCHGVYPHVIWPNPRLDHILYVTQNKDVNCMTQVGCHVDRKGPPIPEATCTSFCHSPNLKGKR